MNISILVISDIDKFLELKDFWDRELRDHGDNPFLFSSMLIEYYKLNQRLGWRPCLFVFLSAGKIIGFAPLVVRSKFGYRQACNLHKFIYSAFFVDEHRKFCINNMVDFLFGHFGCKSVELTFEDGSVNQRTLESICTERGLPYYRVPTEGEAIIIADGNLRSFQSLLGHNRRKNFKKIARKIDVLGSWQIYGVELDYSSINKILEVEKHSWKKNLQGKDKATKNWGLLHILSSFNQTHKSIFDSKVWFLELEDVPIAYQLVLNLKRTFYFIKTSYDARFKKLSPGIFLINNLVERIFIEKTADKIDFISNQPFMKNWAPTVKNRIKIMIERNLYVSKIWRNLFENQFSCKIIEFLESLKWKKFYP